MACRGMPGAPMAAVSLLSMGTVSRVSSVLNKDAKQFGKKYLFDGNEDTCWNSDQGTPQWILLEFPKSVEISHLHIQFQGGFASRTCRLEGCTKNEAFEKITDLYPEDINALQRFTVSGKPVEKLKIVFENSTDFFGRIIVYHLDVLGRKL
ncbi:nuclear receptor 2C2-associated protein [Rhinatrema bivittatum]|uniref:nuclear receptor 2C2-associated protein n=1 Tax=Rhinatrema bivittatum TaxID=194408 RepID=UPI00112EF230|nr:nuclear receptor 2C2-associated protein [Rhinatrema bivittatum]